MIRAARLAPLGLLALALPSPALAKSSERAAAPKNVMVFVGADDRGAENSALKLGQLVEDALGRYDRYNLTSLREAAGDRVPGEARSALRDAEDALATGKKAYAEGKLEDGETSLRQAIKGFEAAGTGLEKMEPYVEANEYLAAVLQLRHKDDDAKDALAQALAVKPGLKLEGKLGTSPVADLLREVRHEDRETHKGSASLFTTPSGGRVFIDGEVRGYTPMSVDRLPVGKHFVRFERPGFQNAGQVVEITSTDDAVVRGKFVPTKDFASIEDTVPMALKEMESSAAGPASFKIIKHFNLDRAIFAAVRTSGDTLVLDLAMVDGSAHRRIARRRNSFEGDDNKNLERDVNHLVAGLIADADEKAAKTDAKGGDPLDHVSGMEDWDDDKGGGRAPDEDSPRKKKKSKDDDE